MMKKVKNNKKKKIGALMAIDPRPVEYLNYSIRSSYHTF